MTGNLVEIGIGAAQGQWVWSTWCASLLLAFLLGVLTARLVLRAHRSPRLSLRLEAGLIAAAATGLLSERLVAETVPGQDAADDQPRLILTILACYAASAAIGTSASDWGVPALLAPAAVLVGATLPPQRWTGLAAERH